MSSTRCKSLPIDAGAATASSRYAPSERAQQRPASRSSSITRRSASRVKPTVDGAKTKSHDCVNEPRRARATRVLNDNDRHIESSHRPRASRSKSHRCGRGSIVWRYARYSRNGAAQRSSPRSEPATSCVVNGRCKLRRRIVRRVRSPGANRRSASSSRLRVCGHNCIEQPFIVLHLSECGLGLHIVRLRGRALKSILNDAPRRG
jgi:hypothetical protein